MNSSTTSKYAYALRLGLVREPPTLWHKHAERIGLVGNPDHSVKPGNTHYSRAAKRLCQLAELRQWRVFDSEVESNGYWTVP